MLTTQYSFLPKAESARWLAPAFIGLYLLLSFVWAFSTNATWDDDCPTRAFNTLHAFSEPIQLISPWNRPLFVLVFALPVQIGFWTIPVLMACFTAIGAWAMYKAVLKLGVPNAALVLPLYLFQTFPFVISHNALTEPLAMTLLALGFWAYVEQKWALFGLAGGLLVLARLELVVLLPIWAYLLVRARAFLPILYLGLPFVLWNVVGGLITGDWTYVFSATLGAAGEESRYGQTPWGHYFSRYIYVLGPVVFYFMLLGLITRIMRRSFTAFIDLQFLLGFMIYVWVGAMVAAGNSAGFLRNLVPISPLAALLALEGLNVYLESAETGRSKDKQAEWVTWAIMGLSVVLVLLSALVFNKALFMHMLFDEKQPYWWHAGITGALALLWLVWNGIPGKPTQGRGTRLRYAGLGIMGLGLGYTAITESPGANNSPEREIVSEVGDLVQPELKGGNPLYVNHIWYFWTQGIDPKANTTRPVTMAALAQAPEGAIVLWDLHYSPRLAGDVRHDYFDEHREWTELLRYRSVEGNFMAMVFVKGKRMHKPAIALSDAYLAQHSELAAAWSAAGNVQMRWGDFAKAEAHLTRATQLDKKDPDAWFSLGLAQLTMRKLPESEASFMQSSRIDPKFPSAWFHLGTVHAGMGRYEQAIDDLNRCIELKPDYANAYFARGTTYGRLDDFQHAIADFSSTIELQPDHLQARFNRGATYAMMRRHDLAVADLRIALKGMPENADGWLFLGRSELAMQNIDAACKAFAVAQGLEHPKADALVAKYCVGNAVTQP